MALAACPESQASCCSRLCFSWMAGTIATAKRKVLDLEDLPDIMVADKAAAASRSLSRHRRDLEGKLKVEPTLSQLLYRAYARDFACAGVVKLGHDVLQYTQPVVIGLLITFIEDGGTGTFWGVRQGFFYAGILFLCQIVQNCFLNAYFHRVYRVGMQARSFIITAIYEKSLRVSLSAEFSDSSTGSIVNLMSNDSARVTRLTSYGHNLWSAPFQIIVAFILLMIYIGPSAIVGLVLMLLSGPAKKSLAKRLGRLRQKVIKVTDTRVKLINDVLQGISIIKYYAWEKSFLKQILGVRDDEMKLMHREILLGATNRTFWNLTPLVVTLSTFAVYAYTGGSMKASKVFTALSLFRRVRFPLAVFPQMVTNLIDFFVASKRITTFLNQRECGGLKSVTDHVGDDVAPGVISVKGASFQWRNRVDKNNTKSQAKQEQDESKREDAEQEQQRENTAGDKKQNTSGFKLFDVTVQCNTGELIMVCGKVGSGKSSLLAAMLGEMDRIAPTGTGDGSKGAVPAAANTNVSLKGSVAYVPQQPWILNKTVRENVLMGMPFDAGQYATALRVSCLVADMKVLPGGDKTEIGEKGINLSGGQKQRVALARAVYANRDIVMLDDPLSALDVHVGKEVFGELIKKHLKHKTVVLVTHDWGLLSSADKIVYLEGGGVSTTDSVESMAEASDTFRALMSQHKKDVSGDGDTAAFGSDTSTVDSGDAVVSSDDVEPALVADADAAEKTGQGSSGSGGALVEVQAEAEEAAGGDTDKATSSSNSSSRSARGKLTGKEMRQRGTLSCTTVTRYFKSFFACMPAYTTIFVITILMGGAEGCNILTNWWLARWSSAAVRGPVDHAFYLGIYAAITLGALMLYFFSQLTLSNGAVNAASKLHAGLLNAVMNAPMWWFETTPSGRTMSRFTKDVDEADNLLRQALSSLFSCFMGSGMTLVLCCILTDGWLGIALLVVIWGYWFILQYYRHTSREMKRLESVTKSPIFSHFAETLHGLTSIRAMALENAFTDRNLHQLDTNHRAYFLTNAANRWLSMRLEVIGGLLTLTTACVLTVVRSGGGLPSVGTPVLTANASSSSFSPSSSDVDAAGVIDSSAAFSAALSGLALVYITQMLNELNWGVRQVSEVEVRMNAVERLLEYQGTAFPKEEAEVEDVRDRGEAAEEDKMDEKLRPNLPTVWPSEGKVTFQNVAMRYRPGLPLALRGVSFEVPGGARVGICGRTGSGKSSCFVSLFRMVEISGGTISIDGVDLRSVDLHTLRSRVACIPQSPVMFVGNVRRNLDPFEAHSDDKIWQVLRDCRLFDVVDGRPGKLSASVAEGGSNFSMGERQLFCIARALLRKPRLLLLDEATASIDAETDRVIQEMVRRVFKDITVLTIAHRLNTIADSDLIIVLEQGKVAEIDAPERLLENPDSMYTALVQKSHKEHAE
jgi:ATP-binding cassette, subfamily C (CFTR/MRP), member 1